MNIYIENDHDIIHETSVDFVLRPCSKEVNIVQYDLTLPIVKVNLYKNGERYALPNDVEANVRFGKLDHTFVYKAVLGCNAERNAVYFQVDEQMTLIAGRVSPTIELKWEYNNTTGFANSSPIPVVITRNPIQESDVESSSYAPLFVEVLLQVDDLRERVENMEAVVTHDVVTLYTDQDDITGKKTFKKEIILGGNVNSRPLLTGILQNGNSSEILTILDVNAVSGTNKGFKLTNIKSISGLITPTANDQAVNKAYADTKVAKVTSSTTLEQAYTKLAGGAQSMHDISASADNNTIALRTAAGTIVVSDPTNPGDAATKRYVDSLIATVYKPQGSATVTQLINLTKTSSMNGYVYNMSNAGTLVDHDGTQMDVLAGDNVVLIWNSGDWYWDKLAGTVDLSPYARKDASNIFSGEINTFNGHVLINGGSRYLGVANIINIRKLWYQDQCTTGTCDIEFTQTYIQINKELKNNLIPAVTNTYSIGNNSKQWTDIWFNGSLKDGAGRSLTLEQISAKYTKPLTGIPESDMVDIHPVGTNITKCKITYNSKGHVTNGQDLNYADIPALHTIIPTDNDLYDLGSNTKYWKNAYIARTIKFGTTESTSLDIIYNINTSDTILTINKDYIQANKSFRTAANVAIEANGLLYAGGSELRYGNDHLSITNNSNAHIIDIHNDYVNFWRQVTVVGQQLKVVAYRENNPEKTLVEFKGQDYDNPRTIFYNPLVVNENVSAEFNGLIWAGGREIRFPDYLEFKDNTNDHNTVVKIDTNFVDFNKTATFKQALNVDGLIYAGGHEIRFPNYLNFNDNTDNHNTILSIANDSIYVYKRLIIQDGAYITLQCDNFTSYTNEDWDTNVYPDKIHIINCDTDEESDFRFPEPDGNDYTLATESYVDTGLSNKVDKVTGKGLSTNDFTNTLKTKLTGIETGAQVNVIESVKVNGTALSVTSKAVNVDVPKNQTAIAIVADATHNINGTLAYISSTYPDLYAQDTTITSSGKTYTVKKIWKRQTGSTFNYLITKEDAAIYMRKMCGSELVPEWNSSNPRNHIFMFSDFSLWKPQWDSTNGLVLYRLSEVQPKLYEHRLAIGYDNGSSTYTSTYVNIIMTRKEEITATQIINNTDRIQEHLNHLLYGKIGEDVDSDIPVMYEGFSSQSNNLYIWMHTSITSYNSRKLVLYFNDNVTEYDTVWN